MLEFKTRTKQNLEKLIIFSLDVGWASDFFFYPGSRAYFKEVSRHTALWVFLVKLKEDCANWEEVVYFN